VQGLNERGDAVGSSTIANSEPHCAYWPAAGGIRPCHPTWADAEGRSWAADLNTQGLYVGFATLGGVSRGFLGLPYGQVPLLPLPQDTASDGTGINDVGEIVGHSWEQACELCQIGHQAAVLWRNGVPYDLNSLLVNGTGWVLQQAVGVSNTGAIAVTGTLNGQSRGAILVPVESPDMARDRRRALLTLAAQQQWDRARKHADWDVRQAHR
jgi:hypothetical protein